MPLPAGPSRWGLLRLTGLLLARLFRTSGVLLLAKARVGVLLAAILRVGVLLIGVLLVSVPGRPATGPVLLLGRPLG